MFHNIKLASIFVLTIILITGCSVESNPVSPPDGVDQEQQVKEILEGVSAELSELYGVLGSYNLTIDPDEPSADLTPIRKSKSTDVLEVVDITSFLQNSPCTDCVNINSVAIDLEGRIILSIGIKHPFDRGDATAPITSVNRGDLHVFNVEGTLFSNKTPHQFTGINQQMSSIPLLNADGYSTYLDSAVDEFYPTEATVHPYIFHFDKYNIGTYHPTNKYGYSSVTFPLPTGNLIMAMGCDYNYKDYIIDAKQGPFEFVFAIGCTYGISCSSKLQRFNPMFRIPQFNKKAASEVHVEVTRNELKELDTATSADIVIEVLDINHGVAVGEDVNEMVADSSIASITIEVPGVASDIVTVDISSPSGSGRDPANPLAFHATITNDLAAGLGSYKGLVKVLDNYPVGINELPLLGGKDGIKDVGPYENPLTGLFEINEFATYALFDLPVIIENVMPTADLTSDSLPIVDGSTILWDASGSSDSDGTIVQYEWDYLLEDGDPLNFTADTVTTAPESTSLSSPYSGLGTLHGAVRVTDNLGGTDIAIMSFVILDPQYGEIYFDFSTIDKKEIHLAGSGFGESQGASKVYVDGELTGVTVTSWQDDEIALQIANDTDDHYLEVEIGGVLGPQIEAPESRCILLVYNSNSTDSIAIKDYYASDVTGRDIKPDMICDLACSTNQTINRATYESEIRDPLEAFITANDLKYRIKYIVLTKFVPLKISKVSGTGYSDLDYAAVESELTLLFSTYDLAGKVYNPYYAQSAGTSFHPFKLYASGAQFAYLVTRLTGFTLDDIYGLIDRGIEGFSGTGAYAILDGGKSYDRMENTEPIYQNLGIDYYFENSTVFLTADTIGDPTITDNVIAYTGHGIHHNVYPPGGAYYVFELNFTLLNGAIFNTYESSNGSTFREGTHSGMGEVADWIAIGGTGGIGHIYEPWADAVGDERYLYPRQFEGHNLAESIYMCLRYLSRVETTVGDPLCKVDVW